MQHRLFLESVTEALARYPPASPPRGLITDGRRVLAVTVDARWLCDPARTLAALGAHDRRALDLTFPGGGGIRCGEDRQVEVWADLPAHSRTIRLRRRTTPEQAGRWAAAWAAVLEDVSVTRTSAATPDHPKSAVILWALVRVALPTLRWRLRGRWADGVPEWDDIPSATTVHAVMRGDVRGACLGNVHPPTGRICWGVAGRPRQGTPQQVAELFFLRDFTDEMVGAWVLGSNPEAPVSRRVRQEVARRRLDRVPAHAFVVRTPLSGEDHDA